MDKNQVTIFAENKPYPTKHRFESFTFRPVLILDGTVTNMRKELDHGKTNISIPKSQK